MFVGEGRGGVNGGGSLFDVLERDFEVERTVEVGLRQDTTQIGWGGQTGMARSAVWSRALN